MDVQGKLLRDCKITYILVILSMLFVLSIKNMKTISICCQSYLAYLYFLWRVGIAYLLYSWLTSFISRLWTWMYIFEKAKLFFFCSFLVDKAEAVTPGVGTLCTIRDSSGCAGQLML